MARLSWPDRGRLAQSLVLLPLVGASLRVLGFGRTRALLTRLAPPPREGAAGEGRARATARLVEAAAREGPYRANCLRRSLVLWWLLRRQRVPAELRLGVRKRDGSFEAHAWVELDGRALNDAPDVMRHYHPVSRL